MCRVDIHTRNLRVSAEAKRADDGSGYDLTAKIVPTADFVGCLLTGAMAALPAFLQAFMTCLGGGGGGTGQYNPGQRKRCQ